MDMKDLPSGVFDAMPVVYAVGKYYHIMVIPSSKTVMWCRVGNKEYYDESNGVLRSETILHKMIVPADELDCAGEYTIGFRRYKERVPYFNKADLEGEVTFKFRKVTSPSPRFYLLSDVHGHLDAAVAAVKAFGKIDFLVVNGDIAEHNSQEKDLLICHRIAAAFTSGEIPVVFSRGNHDLRGPLAEKQAEYTPTENGNSYYTFRLGPVWGIVLDCGEDKPDSAAPYGGVICCNAFRKRETQFLKKVIADRENEFSAPGVQYRIVVSHINFSGPHPAPFNIEYDIYSEWCKLIRENIKPQCYLYGHVHRQYIAMPGNERDIFNQGAPAIAAGIPHHSEENPGFTGAGIVMTPKTVEVKYVNDKGEVENSAVISGSKAQGDALIYNEVMPVIPVPEGLDTRCFVLGPNALKFLPKLLNQEFPGLTPWIVADSNTYEAAGKTAFELLEKFGLAPAEPYIFPGTPILHPDFAYSEKLASLMPEHCVPVAIGSGVINDLVKCASGLKNVPYCCVPTACSVDGFTSAGAALAVNHNKQTVKCPPPWALCADTGIMATAPAPMLSSGFADLLTKVVAGADWIIADAVGEQPIREDVWQLIQGNIRRWISDPADMLNIFEGLAATGYSMQMMLDSRPASGSEHLFSHVWEMEGLQKDGLDVSHGFKVGVGLLATSILMEFIVNNDYDSVKNDAKPVLSIEERTTEIDALLIRGCYGSEPKKLSLAKFKTGIEAEERRALIGRVWNSLQEKLRRQLYTFEELHTMLKKASCPVTPAEIGLSREQFLHGIRTAQLIRNRYTILDFLYEAGLLEKAMSDLEKMIK
ncbi:MAG: iron-containing alcohol dehydrogenase [Lentisphaeria bacterium]|nr:iron-containing alcohol dehydrogenase [Lentisphaeria bacterium]